MTLTDEIIQLKNQGYGDSEIVKYLRDQGNNPKIINDAINRANVKSAVSGENTSQEMQPSLMNQEEEYSPQDPPAPTENYSQGNEESYAPQQNYEQQSGQDYYNQGNGQDYYTQGNAQNYAQGGETDNMIEIAEQVFEQKIGELNKQIQKNKEFRSISSERIENMDRRLKKIEENIDRLQTAILKKVGSYGGSLDEIKDEMKMLEDSFKKVADPLLEKSKSHTKTTQKKTKKK